MATAPTFLLLSGLIPAFVACGTTDEAATLTAEEQFGVLRVCVDQARRRVPVIAGAGSDDTRVAGRNLWAAKDSGADAALTIILYDVPARTVIDIQPGTLARLVSDFPDVFVGIKESIGLLTRVREHRGRIGRDLVQLTGNDELALAFNAMGGVGRLSVTTNVAPRLCAALQAACRLGDYARAQRMQDRLFPFHAALFSDASPDPVKYALTRVRPGFPGALRLPMTRPGEGSRAVVDVALTHAGPV